MKPGLNLRVVIAQGVLALLFVVLLVAAFWDYLPQPTLLADRRHNFGVILITIYGLAGAYLIIAPFPSDSVNRAAMVPNLKTSVIRAQQIATVGFVWGIVFLIIPFLLMKMGLFPPLTRLQILIGGLPIAIAISGAPSLFALHWRLIRAQWRGWLK